MIITYRVVKNILPAFLDSSEQLLETFLNNY